MTTPAAKGRRLQQEQAKTTLDARSETALKRAIAEVLNLQPGIYVMPMNVGAVMEGYKGKTRYVKFGFPGLSDLIGWRRIQFTSQRTQVDDKTGVRWTIGVPPILVPRWLALEVKKPGQVPGVLVGFVVNAQPRYLTVKGKALTRAEQQRTFLAKVRDAGGIAAVVTNVDEALEAVRTL